MDQSKFQKIIDTLKSDGLTDDQIADFSAVITNAASQAFFAEAVLVFDEEDMNALDAITDPAQADYEIKVRYAQKTGKNVAIQMQEFYNAFSDKFLEEYQKNPGNPQEVINNIFSAPGNASQVHHPLSS